MASVTIIFGGQEQKTFTLDKPRMVVGREPDCEIHIDNLGISRNHCALLTKNDTYVVQDLGSSNGTYVNGRKINEYYLNDADEIIIGKYTLRFRNETQQPVAAAAAAASAAAEAPQVPDTLNTYVMDGAKIQEQLAKMRAGQGASGSTPAPVIAAGATAKDYAKALDVAPAPAEETGKMKTLVFALIAVVLVLIGFVVFLMMQSK